MSTERAAVLPSAALYALPLVSVLALVAQFTTYNDSLATVLSVLLILTLFAELVVLPVCLIAYFRHPHVRSRAQAGGLALIAAHLALIPIAAWLAVRGGT